MRHLLVAAFLLAACASFSSQTRNAEPVIEAERAFAARAGEVGWIPAFREFTAPDGQLARGAEFVSAPETLAATPDDGERTLFWAPTYAGIARSGDLGFTTGPASFDAARTPRIQYFTVWRRQPDGSWKWIYDGGPGPVTSPGPYLAASAQVETLAIATRGAGSADAAVAQVSALESGAVSAGLSGRLAGDAHVYRTGRARAYGGADSVAAMLQPNGEVAYQLLRTEASAAGDLVFTSGAATWVQEGSARRGVFARIWQYRPDGWRIVYDQLVGGAAPAQ